MKVLEKVFNQKVFQVLFVIITALMQIPIIHYAYGGYVKYALLFGIIVLLMQVYKKRTREFLGDKANIVSMIFVLLFAFSVILNKSNFLGTNIKQMIYMFLFFILFFGLHESSMFVVSTSIIAVSFVFSLICLLTNVFGIYEWYLTDSEYIIGSFNGFRLWGLYNPNSCGAIAVISIVASLYIIFKCNLKKTWLKIIVSVFLILNILMQYLVLMLSASRGAYYSFLAMIVALVFIYVIKNFKRDRIRLPLRAILAIGLCFTVVFGLLVISDAIQENRNKICIVSEEEANNPDYDTVLENIIESFLIKYSEGSSAFSGLFKVRTLSIGESLNNAIGGRDITDTTGRIKLWTAGFNAFLDKPILGWTREGMVEPVVECLSNGNSPVRGGGVHNIYLTVLCSSGITGFICFVALIGIVIVRFIKRLFRSEPMRLELLFSFAMSFYFLVSELVENRILYQVTFFNVVFWIYFGYLNYYSLKGNEKSEKEF